MPGELYHCEDRLPKARPASSSSRTRAGRAGSADGAPSFFKRRRPDCRPPAKIGRQPGGRFSRRAGKAAALSGPRNQPSAHVCSTPRSLSRMTWTGKRQRRSGFRRGPELGKATARDATEERPSFATITACGCDRSRPRRRLMTDLGLFVSGAVYYQERNGHVDADRRTGRSARR